MEQGLEDREPEFDLPAAGSARRISLREASGRALVLIFHRAVRAHYPSTDDVLISGDIDLSIVPPVYWMSVGTVVNTAYERAAGEIPPDMDPAEHVIIGPDYGGFVSRRHGVRNTGRRDGRHRRGFEYIRLLSGRATSRDCSGDVGYLVGYPESVRDDSHKRLLVAD